MPLLTSRTGVRVDNAIIWPDGRSRRMTWRERIAWRFGRRVFPRGEVSLHLVGQQPGEEVFTR